MVTTSGWESPGQGALLFQAVTMAQPKCSNRVVTTPLGPFNTSSVLEGILLSLAGASAEGTLNVTVVAKNAAGCEAAVAGKAVEVLLQAPSLSSLQSTFGVTSQTGWDPSSTIFDR
jgi:hypothetical protein